MLLQPSHQNCNLDVDYSTPEIMKSLLLSPHFPLFSPNHIYPLSCLGQTSLPPCPCTHCLAHSSGHPCFFHPIQNFSFTFYGPADKHSMASLLTSSYRIHLLSVSHQFSFSIHVLHAKLRKQQQLKKVLNKVCGYYPVVP